MLTEEAHHLFVGESGVARIVQRTCEVMRDHQVIDAAQLRALGVIDLETIQKFVNFHFAVTLDLYGSEVSSNAANYYTAGLKGRFQEGKLTDDHKLSSDLHPVQEVEGGQIVTRLVPALTALNTRLRDDYIAELQNGLDRWNRIPVQLNIPFRFTLPHVGFLRKIGKFAAHHISPSGELMTEPEWSSGKYEWIPSPEDHAFIESLMVRVIEPGKFAGWIAPPVRGIKGQPIDFEYVRFN
jgi:benzoyl-CoA 2,3-dioxygenase component B